MAISEIHYRLLETLHNEGKLPQKYDLLEIGEATWYGDVLPESVGLPKLDDPRAIVREVYFKFFGLPLEIETIDMSGGEHAIKHDLNFPINLERKFSLVMNHGTAEHIFNIANVFKVAHDHCEVGGLMIHESPWRGWPDHGFYCLQPTLFYDVAHANNYRVELMAGEDITNKKSFRFYSREEVHTKLRAGELPEHLCIFAAFRKLFDRPFQIPQQHVYSPFATEQAVKDWHALR